MKNEVTNRRGAWIYALGVLVIGISTFIVGLFLDDSSSNFMSGIGLMVVLVGAIYVRALRRTSSVPWNDSNQN